ncbi:hypothetical protein [Pseudomonas sp. C9-3]|uniref:LexA family protein n=1 Tax=Pseudomonas sp. C9-3 TaxID=3078264 RepID=UPI0028E73DD5|nr:hypothetical protein [Pseudomonas sp. C9-3]
MSTASPKQAETLGHIRTFIADKGYSPTVAELAALAGVNPNAVHERLMALKKKGLIHHTPEISRSVRPA